MLDWEENVFVGLRALYRKCFVRPKQKREEEVLVALKDHRRELLLLAQMLAGKALTVFETDEGRLGAGDRVFLPDTFRIGPDAATNAALYELKTIAAALALRENWTTSEEIPLEARLTACAEELPGLQERIAAVKKALPDTTNLWEILGTLPLPETAPGAASVLAATEPEPGESGATTEIEGKGQIDVTVLPDLDDDDEHLDMPMHTFEKIETLEEYDGQSRKSDADDELDEHAEGLRDLKMRQVIRSPGRAGSIYRADIILDGLVFEIGDEAPPGGIPYPEWDFRRRRYRENWCHVQPERGGASDPQWVGQVALRRRALIGRLRRQFAAITAEWLRVKRQTVGSEFDLDAVVDSEVRRRTGAPPSEALYTDVRRDLQDVAALLLVDLSYSTDAWLDGVRVLDTIRETIFCVGEVLDDFIEKFAVAGFSSNTRRSCHFNLLKDFHEPWHPARGRLGSLQPSGYTRIGAALRHGQELLQQQHARRKIVLLVTDGRPCDYDRYEGNYGIHDVRKALESGRRNGIAAHAFAIEKRAAEYFPQMFTHHHFDIIQSPERLSQTMCKRFARLQTE
jgi:nitric oxide reductase NorD protein